MLVDLLLPRTDALVYVEVMVVSLIWVLLLWRFRHRRELQQLASGIVVCIYAWFALRAVH